MPPALEKPACPSPGLQYRRRGRDAVGRPRRRASSVTSGCVLAALLVLSSDAFSVPRSSSSGAPRRRRPSPNESREAQSSRYFTVLLQAPPLVPYLGDDLEDEFAAVVVEAKYQTPLDVVYTNDPRSVATWLAKHVPSGRECVLGLDTEAVPSRGAPWISRRQVNFMGPATVQLSTLQSSLVVHLARRNGKPCQACAPVLETVLRNPNIVKAGCSIDDDLVDLREQRWPDLEATSRLDLNGLRVPGGNDPGLKRLTRNLLGLDLPKVRKVSASDWSRVPLTEEQVVYAGRDAWAAAAVADQLRSLDPEAFDPTALVERLTSSPQRSLRELSQRREDRKQAKAHLDALYGPREERPIELPPWKLAMIAELKAIIQDNRNRPEVLYVAARNLGFVGATNQTAS